MFCTPSGFNVIPPVLTLADGIQSLGRVPMVVCPTDKYVWYKMFNSTVTLLPVFDTLLSSVLVIAGVVANVTVPTWVNSL